MEVQGAQLLAGFADQVAFADQDLVGVIGEGFALGAVAPARDSAARTARAEREVLEAQDLDDGRAGVRSAHRDGLERTGVGAIGDGMGDLLDQG